MRTSILLRRVPWFASFLVACDGGDSVLANSESGFANSATESVPESHTGDGASTNPNPESSSSESSGNPGSATNSTTLTTTTTTSSTTDTSSTTETETDPTTSTESSSTANATTETSTGIESSSSQTETSTTTSESSSSSDGSSSSSSSSESSSEGPDGECTADDDALFTAQNLPLVVDAGGGVLANDTDPDCGVLTVADADVVTTAGGTVAVAADGSVSYTPPAGFWGPDTFDYVADDGIVQATGTVTVHVAPIIVPLASVTAGLGGFAINGEAAGDYSGGSVSDAGDVNGDGILDVIVGSYRADPNGEASGRSYVVFGRSDTDLVELSEVTSGIEGFAIDGEVTGDLSGFAVANAGDVNGDGLDDVVIGAYRSAADGEFTGRTYVVFGKVDTATVQLTDIVAGIGGFALDGEAAYDTSALSVHGAGDVNGDGLDDVVIGALGADPNGALSGRCYVVFGKVDTAFTDLTAITAGVGGFVMEGEAIGDRLGYSVSAAGDVNGDGLDDVIVSSFQADFNGAQSGRTYVVFGKVTTAAVELSAVAAGNGAGFAITGEAAGDYSGNCVSGAGDVNGDGLSDLLVGALGNDANAISSGRAYVVFGKVDGTAVELSDVAAGAGGFAMDGAAASDRARFSVSGAGDMNGDDLDDVIIGAWEADPNGLSSGRVYVVYGKADTAIVELADVATGVGGFALDGEAPQDAAGHCVSGAGDMNGDGVDDLIIGAYRADPNGLTSGRNYVVFGVRTE
jgi:hypothetical protein